MKFSPYPYQKAAVKWILDRPRCALFLDMGLGKTVVTLTAVKLLMDDCEVTRTLVVAPKRVAESTWATESAKWDHLSGLRVSLVLGDVKARRKALAADADVYVVSRDLFVWLCGECRWMLPFDMLVLDELSSFKSAGSLRSKAVRKVTAGFSRVVGLTGTPAANGLGDLWAEMYCIDCGERLGKYRTRFRDAYFSCVVWNNVVIKEIPKPGAREAIEGALADICLSMRAEDYLSLPPMVERDIPVVLPEKAMREYRTLERDSVLSLPEGDVTAVSAAALVSKLSQCANGSVYDENGEARKVHGAKAERLAEIVEAAGGSPVLVFYEFLHDVPAIEAALRGWRVRRYGGPSDLDDWNAGKVDVMLAHPASVAYGLNMQGGGHYVVWYGLTWNLELYTQANARLHRQGQRYPVTVLRLLGRGTVDERAAAALRGKDSEQTALLKAIRDMRKEYLKENLR